MTPLFHIGSDGGHIGPFWWFNANTGKTIVQNATYNGSLHNCWRQGVCGWGSPTGKRFLWRIIK